MHPDTIRDLPTGFQTVTRWGYSSFERTLLKVKKTGQLYHRAYIALVVGEDPGLGAIKYPK